MKIIFDTNQLYADNVIKNKLPNRVSGFLEICKKNGHEIIIPHTTLLEFDRKQNEIVSKERKEIELAAKKLTEYKISVGSFSVDKLIKPPSLISLIKNCGLNCKVEMPTKRDFVNAHRKACLREDPHSSDTKSKSDEMRDLVIWEISLRLARENDGAILISKDTLLIHHRGDMEAAKFGLIRCEDFERAKEALNLETVSGRIIGKIVKKVWDQIISSNKLPLAAGAHLVCLKEPRFKNAKDSVISVNAGITVKTGYGKSLRACLRMDYVNDTPFLVEFSQIQLDDEPLPDTIRFEYEMPLIPKVDFDERLSSLRESIGG